MNSRERFPYKGKEDEGIESGIDVSLERTSNVGDDESMIISPITSQEPAEKSFKYPSLHRKGNFQMEIREAMKRLNSPY